MNILKIKIRNAGVYDFGEENFRTTFYVEKENNDDFTDKLRHLKHLTEYCNTENDYLDIIDYIENNFKEIYVTTFNLEV